MSVTHQPSYNFRRARVGKSQTLGDQHFEQLEIVVEPDSVTFKHVDEGGNLQLMIMWGSAFLFMIFVVSVMPIMQLTMLGNALSVMVALLVLATVGLIVQARVETTTIQLSTKGIRVEHGTAVDSEVAEVDWEDLGTVELEPVDAKMESKGMHLEIRPTQGEPIRTLPGVGVGDLNAVRQAILKARRGTSDH